MTRYNYIITVYSESVYRIFDCPWCGGEVEAEVDPEDVLISLDNVTEDYVIGYVDALKEIYNDRVHYNKK